MKILLDFFRPTLAKVILFSLLSAFLLIDHSAFIPISDSQTCSADTTPAVDIGYPVTYYTRHYLQPSEFELDSLAYNLLLIYFLVCVIITFVNFCVFVARKGPGKELLILVTIVANLLVVIFVVTNVLGESWLVKSVQAQRSRTVKNFLAIGVSADSRNEKGTTFALLEASKIGNLELMEILLKSGANANLENNQGTTSLHIAAKYNRAKAVEYLLNNKGNPNKRDKDGKTPLYFACGLKVTEFLMDKGAKPSLVDNTGKTAMFYIKDQSALAKIQSYGNKKISTTNPAEPVKTQLKVESSGPVVKAISLKPLIPLKTPTSKMSCTTSVGGSFISHGKTYRIITKENGDITIYKGVSGFIFANCADTGYYHLILQGQNNFRKVYTNLVNNNDQSAPLIYANRKDLILDFKIPVGQGKLYWYFSKNKIDNLIKAVNNDKVSMVTINKLLVEDIGGK